MKTIVTHIFCIAALAASAQAQELDPVAGNAELSDLAKQARARARGMTFEEFRDSTVYVEETGKYYVNGDTPVRNEKLLREFWAANVANEPPPELADVDEFAVITVGGLDQIWSPQLRHALTYCVSSEFGTRHAAVVANMDSATAALEAVGDLDFHYIAAQDGACNASNTDVLFDVRPVNAGGDFLAAAFFPNDPRAKRSVIIDPSSFQLDPNGALTLTGILRHELGHTIGGRHEHTRPEAGTCFEDNDWRGVTDYDAFSFMHYPQCNGQGDWTLRLTESDKNAIACLYGPAAGFTIDPAFCSPAGGIAAPITETFGPITVAQGASMSLGEVGVTPGTPFVATMTGTGDPDLYVKLGGPALATSYDCRPYVDGPDETCDFEVPAGETQAFVMVRGYTEGTATVTITHTTP